jgi:hypothetical protein
VNPKYVYNKYEDWESDCDECLTEADYQEYEEQLNFSFGTRYEF